VALFVIKRQNGKQPTMVEAVSVSLMIIV